jgi:hypothetical protein
MTENLGMMKGMIARAYMATIQDCLPKFLTRKKN